MEELVPDATQTGMDSRHFHAINPLVVELDRNMGMVRRADTRPWKGDVRQAGVVEPAPENAPEKTEEELVFGKPDEIELRELRRYSRPDMFMGADGSAADTFQVVEAGGNLLVGAESQLHRVTKKGQHSLIEDDAPTTQWHLASNRPEQYRLFPSQGKLEKEVAVQRNGLDIQFAGRGQFEITVNFTGVLNINENTPGNVDAVSSITSTQDGTEIKFDWEAAGVDLSGEIYLEEGLELYGADNGETYNYEISGDTLTILGADGVEEFTFYYRGVYEETYTAAQSARLGSTPEHSISISDLADYLAELPSENKITCIATTDHLASVPIQGGRVGVTKSGYVGHTFLGHDVRHLLPGPRHVLAVGDGTLSICEPEANKLRQFTVPTEAAGLTWTDEGLLGLIEDTGSEFVLYGINERRHGQTSGITPNPPIQ